MSSYGSLEAGVDTRVETGVPSSQNAFATQNSVYLTAALIIADVVGAGILGMPVAMSKLGWLPGLLTIVLLLAMNVHISLMMWRVRMHFPNVRCFMDMIEMAWSKAPEGQRTFIVRLGGFCQYGFLCAMLGVYLLSSGRALGNLFYDVRVCLPSWALLGCAIILPFIASARRLGAWASLVWMNVGTIAGTCIIPLLYMWGQGIEATRAPGAVFLTAAPFHVIDVFPAISTCCFAFSSQFMVIEMIAEMKQPAEFKEAYMYMAAPFQAVCFMVVGIGGYYFMGDKVSGMIGDNIPFGVAFRFAAVCLLTHMVITFLVKGIVLCRAVHTAIDKDADNDNSKDAWRVWGGLVSAAAVAAWLVACTVPFFNELVSFAGTTVTPLCCYLIPIACYLRWVNDFGSKENGEIFISSSERVIIMMEAAVALALMTVGTYFAVKEIILKWGSFGPPFACHCQHMWKTCECSATHAGMFDICKSAVQGAAESLAIQVNEMVDTNFVWMFQKR